MRISIIYLLVITLANLSTLAAIDVSFGPVKVGEKRLRLNLDTFSFVRSLKSESVSYKLIKGSTQWIRTKENILIPRALASITVKSSKTVSISYEGKNILVQGSKNKKNLKIYVNLFDSEEMKIYEANKLIETLRIYSNEPLENKNGHLIDYSCSSYGIEIKGLDDQFVSAGCMMETLGRVGKEYQRMTFSWSTPNYHLENGMRGPYTSVFMNSTPLNFELIDDKGNKKTVTIKTNVRTRFHRLKTAIGFGPYSFKAVDDESERETKVAPAAMIYAKWDLDRDTSFRAFDAFIYNESLFNNAGLYFAYNLAKIFDGRIEITPLLGAQILSNKYDSNSSTTNRIIYPQGFEVFYKHAFGIKNYSIVYGMFLSTDSEETYDNAWIRWGKGYFWELNYIRWARDGEESSMWGLSIGIPTGQYF